jgi:hypothetical protein
MIDYARMKKVFPKQKAALTRAAKITDPIKRYKYTLVMCEKTVQEWDLIGAWPDAWSAWQRALDDATFMAQRAGAANLYLQRLEEL